MNMDLEQPMVPVYLVAETLRPIASTSSARGIGVVCFVAVSSLTETDLFEIALHEAIHVLDLRSQFRTSVKPTALNQMRQKLRDVGLQPNDPLVNEIPHKIIFVQAAETVRRLIDPARDPFGPDHPFYRTEPEAGAVVLQNWKAYLDGSITLDAALNAIAEGLWTSAEK